MKTENIIATIINTEKYEHLMENIPHKDFLNLSVIYRDVTITEDGSTSAIIISNNTLKKLEMTVDELHDIAVSNTKAKFPLAIEEIDENFFVLTNDYRLFGAVGIVIAKDMLKGFAKYIDNNLYILPSSIHEVFLLPDIGQDADFLKCVVEDANKEVVKGKDYLSDNVYYYDRNTGHIKIIR